MMATDENNKTTIGPWLWLGIGLVLVLVTLGVGLGVATGRVAMPGQAASTTGAEGQAAKPGDSKGGKGDKPEVALEFMPREVVQPSLARLASSLELSGPLVAPQSVLLRAKTGGALLSLTVAEGSRVRAGQVLGNIEMAGMDSRLAERSALIESARASVAQAERSHINNERLAQLQFISAMAVDASRSALEVARAQLAAAQAALNTTRAGLADGSLVAPISGIVAKRHVLPGEKLSPEQQVLSIVDLRELELASSVGTHQVSRLAVGMAVQIRVEGLAQPVPGRIARIAPAAEPGTRAIGVAIALDNSSERLRAGQYATAHLALADATQRLTLPLAALGGTGRSGVPGGPQASGEPGLSSGQDHVWLIDNGVLVRRAVLLGQRDAATGRVEVLEGVTPDSVVLAARFDNLREGAKARLIAGVAVPPAVSSASASASAMSN